MLFVFNKSYGYDSLTTALNLYQSAQFQKALPFFLSLSRKYEKANEIEKYSLCQLKIADMIRVYGGPHVGLLFLILLKPTHPARHNKFHRHSSGDVQGFYIFF